MGTKTEAVSPSPHNPELFFIDDGAAVVVTHDELPLQLAGEAEHRPLSCDQVNHFTRRRIADTNPPNNKELVTNNVTSMTESWEDSGTGLFYNDLIIDQFPFLNYPFTK